MFMKMMQLHDNHDIQPEMFRIKKNIVINEMDLTRAPTEVVPSIMSLSTMGLTNVDTRIQDGDVAW